jgi:hypothetical protein
MEVREWKEITGPLYLQICLYAQEIQGQKEPGITDKDRMAAF